MKTHLNLLPTGYLRARLVRRRLALWLPVWLAVAALGAANWWSSYVRCAEAARLLETRERRYEPVQRMVARIGAVRRRIKDLNDREAMLGELSEPHPPLSGLELVGRSTARCEGRVRVDQLLLERDGNRNAAASGGRRQTPAPAAGRSSITLEGTGLDNVAVAAFVETLRQTEGFSHVELKSTTLGAGSGAMCKFVVVCEY